MEEINKAIALAEKTVEMLQKSQGGSTVTLQKSHVKGYTRKDGTQVKEHDDSRSKQTPPQADSNRHEWNKLPDDENPNYALHGISSKSLGKIAQGETDIRHHAKAELASRGVDEHGKWMGFDKAKAHHGVTTDHLKGDNIGDVAENLQTVHHKVLGAIASGHTDAKKLASEELANRGHDHNGKWVGFDKASKLHGTK